jgi:hypothetical protein
VTERKWFAVGALLGLAAMILPVLVSPPTYWHDAPLFPVIRNAQEDVGWAQIVLLFLVGGILGAVSPSKPLRIGLFAVILLPLAAFAEMAVDSTSHNLWPFEFVIYAFYGAVVAAGAALVQKIRRRRGGELA